MPASRPRHESGHVGVVGSLPREHGLREHGGQTARRSEVRPPCTVQEALSLREGAVMEVRADAMYIGIFV